MDTHGILLYLTRLWHWTAVGVGRGQHRLFDITIYWLYDYNYWSRQGNKPYTVTLHTFLNCSRLCRSSVTRLHTPNRLNTPFTVSLASLARLGNDLGQLTIAKAVECCQNYKWKKWKQRKRIKTVNMDLEFSLIEESAEKWKARFVYNPKCRKCISLFRRSLIYRRLRARCWEACHVLWEIFFEVIITR